jgi:general secretion pathway protein C
MNTLAIQNVLAYGQYFLSNLGFLRPYLAAIILGLGLSRFTDAMVLYMLSDNVHTQVQPKTYRSNITMANRSLNVDPVSVIGGVLFSNAPVANTPEAIVEEAKNFTLIGTLEGDPSFARAVVRIIEANSQPQEFGIGQKIGNALLIAIGREKIWVKQNNVKFAIKVGEDTNQAAAASASNVAPSASGTITKILSRQEVNEKILGNPGAMYQGASFGPNLVDGKIQGYKIHRVNETHIFYTLGARSGDVITAVNGYPLSDTEQMLELWKNIKTMPRIQVNLIRNNQPLNYDFQIRN